MKSIPRKIHYCWFGGKPLTPFAKKCIESWKKYCPDYEIIEWSEKNIDIVNSPFMQAAYADKKWAFVSDYARYKIIYEEGGIYLDVDVELIKSIDDLRKYNSYMGFEGTEYVASGLGFGAHAGDEILKEVLNKYEAIDYEQYKDNPAKIATPIIVTDILVKHGLVRNGELQVIGSMTILPEDYLCPKSPMTRLVNITKNSYSIHHYDASWVDENERKHIDLLEEKGKEITSRFPDLITIIIPVYNGQDYLTYAIDSALSQTYKNIEVIVVDDGSSDKSEVIARSYGSRIRYIRKPNGGVSSALNMGITSARGKYIAWLSHDDVYHERKLEVLHKTSIREDKRCIAISDWDVVDKDGVLIKHSHLDERLESAPLGFLAFDRRTWLNACAMLFPKALFDEVGLFDESLRTTQDYDMHMRMIKAGATYKIVREQLFFSRQHAMQGSLTIDDDTFANSDRIHTEIILKLTKNDLEKYFSNNLEKINETYRSFADSGYVRAPAALFNKLVEIYRGDSRLVEWFIKKNFISIPGELGFQSKDEVLSLIKNKKRRPRIIFCAGYWLTGGMERVLSNLFIQLQKKYEIILITPSDGEAPNRTIPLPDEITHIRLSSDLYRDRFDTITLSYALLFHVDVVVGFLNLFDKQLNLYAMCREYGIKTIASNHEYYFYPHRSTDPYMRSLVDLRRRTFANLDAVLWLTNFSTAVHNIDASNGYLMPNPNTFPTNKRISINRKTKNVVCIGRFNDRVKRVDRIISCFASLQRNIPESTLTLVGAVDLDAKLPHMIDKSINDLIEKAGIDRSKIICHGEVKDMVRIYDEADVILLTSETEGFPMVLTEAMSRGVPVVCGDIPGIEDIVVNKVTGFVVAQDDSKSMADKIVDIFNNPTLKKELSKNALEHVKQFNAEKVAQKWVTLIDALLLNDWNSDNPVSDLPKAIAQERRLFEERIMKELEESVRQSVIMAKSMIIEVEKEGVVKKSYRLARSTARDLKNKGLRHTSKKVVKKVTKKMLHAMKG